MMSDSNPVLDFIKRWRDVMVTFLATVTAMGVLMGGLYKVVAEERVADTARKAAEAVIDKKIKPIQVDVQNISAEIKKLNREFDTVHSQQVQVIVGIDFLKELLIETDEVSYQKVKRRRELRRKK